MSDMRRILDGVQQFPRSSSSVDGRRGGGTAEIGGGGGGSGEYDPPLPEDEEDFSVLRYGTNCVLKSRQVLLVVHNTSDCLCIIFSLTYTPDTLHLIATYA